MAVKISVNKNRELTPASSKFFGEVALEKRWLEDGTFSPTDVFLCRVNLQEVAQYVDLPDILKDGALLFFIDIEDEPVSCRVLFTKKEDYSLDFNETGDELSDEFDEEEEEFEGYDTSEAFAIDFSKGDKNTAMFVNDDKVFENEVCLLRYFPEEFTEIDFLSDIAGAIYIIIDRSAFEKADFKDAKVYFAENKKLS